MMVSSPRVTTTLVRGKVEVAVGDKTQVLQPDQQLAVEAGRFTLKQVVAEDYIGCVELDTELDQFKYLGSYSEVV